MRLLSGITSKKHGGTSPKAPSRFLLRVGLILLMLGLIAFAVYQLVSHMTVGLDTLRTQEITEESYIDLELLVFRNEEVLTADGDVFRYHVSDGERVGKDDLLATAYRTEDADEMQELLNLYVRRLSLAESQDRISMDQADAIKRELEEAYQTLLSSADDGDAGMAADAAGHLKTALSKYAALSGKETPDGDQPASLRTAISELLAGCLPIGDIAAEKSGYFYYETDGYERLFDPDQLMTLTPDELERFKTAEAVSYGNGVMGKMVYSSTWYAATYLEHSEADAADFAVGNRYTMLCDDSVGTQIPMTVIRAESTEEGVLLIFEANTMPTGYDCVRLLRVQTVTDRVSGYRIPREALVTLTENSEEVTGVYILAGNVVEFRMVYILEKRESYVIVATYEDVKTMQEALTQEEAAETVAEPDTETSAESGAEEQAAEEAETKKQPDVHISDQWSYLRLNDKIITRGTGLYEGKMIS